MLDWSHSTISDIEDFMCGSMTSVSQASGLRIHGREIVVTIGSWIFYCRCVEIIWSRSCFRDRVLLCIVFIFRARLSMEVGGSQMIL